MIERKTHRKILPYLQQLVTKLCCKYACYISKYHLDGKVAIVAGGGRDGGGPGASAYATAKGAVMTFTRSMAKELGPQNIRVNALCPGMIATTFHDTFTKDAVRTNVAAGTPLRREGDAKEVADTVAYLASDEASFLTGVNGGLFMS